MSAQHAAAHGQRQAAASRRSYDLRCQPSRSPGGGSYSRLSHRSQRAKCDTLKPLSYRPTTELGALASALIADLERVRPGFSETADAAQTVEQCAARVRLRLPELYSEYQGEAGSESEAQLALYTREVEQVLIPRYAKLAQQQNQIERQQTRGALYNRLSYAALFFALGLFIVWAPFIPIWEKWVPFALAIVAPLLTPWLPDLYQSLRLRQHRLGLGLLLMDLDEAGRTLPLPPLFTPALPGHLPSEDRRAKQTEGSAAQAALPQKKEWNGNAG